MGGENDTASTNSAITPTTNKFLTELFESENCVDKLETIEKEGFLVPLPPVSVSAAPNANKETSNQNQSRRSFIKLDSSSWQGGTTTVVTPTKSEQLTILDVPSSLTTMKTRNSNRINRPVAAVQAQPKRQATMPKKSKPTSKEHPKVDPGSKPVQMNLTCPQKMPKN